MSLPLSVHRRLPRRLPHSLGFKRYSLYFDGSSYYVEVPDNPLLRQTPITVEVVARWDRWSSEYGRYQHAVSKQDTAYNGYAIQMRPSDNHLEASWGDGTAWHTVGDFPARLGEFYHLFFIHDGESAYFYAQGELNDVVEGVPITHTTNVLRIGRSSAYPPYMQGAVALLRVYTRVLSRREIRHNVLNYHNPVRDGLVLWYHDRVTADTWYDESGYGNDGTVYGAVRENLAMWELRAEVGL